jgi:putative DNA primase/helicase
MAWLIDGCRKWYESGYGNYSTVSEATEQYKRDEDVLGNFIHECCTTDQGFAIQANVLRTAFEKWCAENGERVFSGRAWRQALEERGFHREHGRNGKIWKGLTLNINEEENEVPFL